MNEDEGDMMHELLAPGNFRETGPMTDDDLYSSFVAQVPKGVHATVIIDTCHPASFRSGKSCAIDLPYVCSAGDEELRYSEGFRPGRMTAGAGIAAGAAAVVSKAKKKKKDKKKKQKEGEEDELVDASEVSSEAKSKKKSKNKKKKKQESDENGGDEEKSKKKKKKKKPKE